jgi:hypothetical protein
MYVQVEQNVPVHDGSSFKWERYDNPSSLEGLYTGIANLSSLIPPGATHYSFPWTDDDTPGFYVQSHRTGQKVLFWLKDFHTLWPDDQLDCRGCDSNPVQLWEYECMIPNVNLVVRNDMQVINEDKPVSTQPSSADIQIPDNIYFAETEVGIL